MNNLTDKLQQWLDTPSAERDWNEGAILLLQLTNNTIMYRNLSINPKGKAEFIEGKLRAFLKARREVEAHDEVNIMQEQVDAIVASRTEFKEHNEAKDFKAGKRADHDSLPEDIQALYVENLDITHRMRELHLRLRLLSDSTKQVPGTYVAALYTVELAQLAHGGVVSLGYLGECVTISHCYALASTALLAFLASRLLR